MSVCMLLCLFSYLCGASVLELVDPFIGSGGVGYGAASVPVGAQLPFSSVRLSPDTSHDLRFVHALFFFLASPKLEGSGLLSIILADITMRTTKSECSPTCTRRERAIWIWAS